MNNFEQVALLQFEKNAAYCLSRKYKLSLQESYLY